jgi:uncharacterized protein YaaR (DUF327 family)
MKIEPIDSSNENTNPTRIDFISAHFSPIINQRVERVMDENLRRKINDLIVDIDQKGKKLLTAKKGQEFDEYKSAIKAFLQTVLDRSIKMEGHPSQRKDGKFVVHFMLKKVDEALDDIARILLVGQQDSIKLLARLDEIRGLLLDFYL